MELSGLFPALKRLEIAPLWSTIKTSPSAKPRLGLGVKIVNLFRVAEILPFFLFPLSGYAQPLSGEYLRPALWCGAASIAASAAASNPGPRVRVADAEIRQLLDAQVLAWNRGDLEGYMSGYWNSGELTFFSGTTETGGWKATLERYRRHYKKSGSPMGRLAFKHIRIETFGEQMALACGQWRLETPNGPTRAGLFTLMLRRFSDGWRIVHDHSS